MSNIIDILIDNRFKIHENDNAAAVKSLKAIEKVFNEISKKTADDVTTNDIKQIIGALQNFSGIVKNKNALVVDGTNILDVANDLGRKVAAREKFNAEQNQQQNTQQVQSENDKDVDLIIDGEKYYKTFNYGDITHDNGGGMVGELIDVTPDDNEIEMLRAIVTSEKTIVRYQGDDYYDDYVLTDADKSAIEDVLIIYDYMNMK